MATDNRVQVSYDPSEITLAPTVQQTRGSGTVVQAMPQTNQALNFARALNQVPAILGAAKNIGQKQAEEDFSLMSEAERKAAMEDDKKISRWLGYDKTFQEELVKDHFVRTKGDITKRFTNLAANPAAYGSDGEFDAAITEEKQALIGELQEKFGNNPNRVMALNAFGDKIMTEVIGQTTEMYETNKINYTLDIKGAHLADQLLTPDEDTGEFKAIAPQVKTYLDDIKGLDGVDNKLAKANFVANMTAIAKELESNEQYGRAAEVVQAALDYEFYKGAKIAGKERGDLAKLLGDIETKTADMPRRVRNQAEATKDSFSMFTTYAALADKEMMVESAKAIFTELGYTEEQLKDIKIDTTSPNSAFLSFQAGMMSLLQSNPNELQREVLRELNQSINVNNVAERMSKAVIGTHSPEEYARFQEEINNHVLTNLNTDISQINLRDDEGRIVSVSDATVALAIKDATNRIKWYTEGTKISQFNTTFSEVTSKMNKMLDGVDKVIEKTGYDTEMQQLLLSEGQRVWDESGGDFKVFNKEYPKAMQQIVADREAEISERSNVLYNNANRIKELNKVTEKLTAGEERSDKDKMDFTPFTDRYKYNSLVPDEYNAKIIEFSGDEETQRDNVALWGMTERQAILDADTESRKLLLPAHLIRYGFPTFDSVEIGLLRANGLGIADIPLGLEIKNAVEVAYEGYLNQNEGSPTTTEQLEAMRKFEDKFGISNGDDLEAFDEAVRVYETELQQFSQQ
jgi:hypothetical protein